MNTKENLGLPRWHSGIKNPPATAGDAGDMSLIPGSGRSPGVANGNPHKYSCLENSMDRGAWQATVRGGRKRVRRDRSHLGQTIHGEMISTVKIINTSIISHRYHCVCGKNT